MIDTKSFMVGAYTVATLIYVAYTLSLWNRARRVSRNLAALSETRNRAGADSDSSTRSR